MKAKEIVIENCLYSLRRDRHMTQDELAKKLGIQRSTLSVIENNFNHVTNFYLVLKIAKELNMTVEEIFWLKEDK